MNRIRLVLVTASVAAAAFMAPAAPAQAFPCWRYGCWGPGYYGAGWYNGYWWNGGWYDPAEQRSDGSPYSCPVAWNLCGPPPQYQKCGPC